MVFTPILLLNMLIAMMGNTYCEVITQSEKEWMKQWANIIVALERSIDSKSAKEFVQTYSIKMPSTDKETEVRGVIVIKTKLKSKAKEKKQALSLWKRVGKRTIQELRKVGGKAADVRRKYHLFRPKQPTARLRMGKVVQEWNPAPMPVFTDNPAPASAPINLPGLDTGFNDLLSQVTSASGIDIEKPTDLDLPENVKRSEEHELKVAKNTEIFKPPDYNECSNPNGYVNLAFESNNDIKGSKLSDEQKELKSNHEILQQKPNTKSSTLKEGGIQSGLIKQEIIPKNTLQQEMIQPNSIKQEVKQINPLHQPTVQLNSVQPTILQPNTFQKEILSPNPAKLEVLPNQKEGTQMNSLNSYTLKSETLRWEEPSQANFLEKFPDINSHSEQLQPVKLTDEKGISVSIQTRIISTRVTKTRTRRRKDAVFPLRNEYSDSTSEKETKRGFLLHKKDGNVAGANFKGGSKYKKRRKRNQISFQEKISVDNVPYDIPVSMENQVSKLDMER